MYGREKMDGTVELVAAARRKGALLPEAKRVDTWATKADRPLRREMAGELHTPLDVTVHASTNGRRMENLLYCCSAKSYRSASFSGEAASGRRRRRERPAFDVPLQILFPRSRLALWLLPSFSFSGHGVPWSSRHPIGGIYNLAS